MPARWRHDIARVLIPADRIAAAVSRLARQIERQTETDDLCVVSLLNGTVLFLADLIRRLQIPLRLDFVGVSSYRGGTRPGKLLFTKDLIMDVRGRDVLLVDDILDTGNTLLKVKTHLARFRPYRIRTCVLLDKPDRRVKPVEADHLGFVIPDEFVVGYGLDYAERYRNLPFIGVLKPTVIQRPEQ